MDQRSRIHANRIVKLALKEMREKPDPNESLGSKLFCVVVEDAVAEAEALEVALYDSEFVSEKRRAFLDELVTVRNEMQTCMDNNGGQLDNHQAQSFSDTFHSIITRAARYSAKGAK